MIDDKGKRVLVTGAAGGAGKAIAQAFVKAGAEVIATDIDESRLRALADEIQLRAQLGDLSSREGCRTLAAQCGPIDILINAAAFTVMKYQSVLTRDDAYWDRTIAVDLIAPVTLMQELVPGMVERKSGNVINISSVSATRGSPDLAPYAAAKAALETMSRVAAMELAMRETGVRVNCIAFGLVDTAALARNFPDRTIQDAVVKANVPLGRLIRPEEVADLCVYLASDMASAILGTVLTIEGGMNAGAYSHADAFISAT